MRLNVKTIYALCRRFDHCSQHRFNLRYLSTVELSEQQKNKLESGTVKRQALKKLLDGPQLKDFITKPQYELASEDVPYLDNTNFGHHRKVYFDVHGCQMNVNDTEIVWSILKSHNYLKTDDLEDADIVLVMTCAIREGAETKIWNKLENLKGLRNKKIEKNIKPRMKIGILGCMAERLKEKILEKERTVDIIAGPDSYKDLPRLLAVTENDQIAINVLLSLDETYADIMPVRLNENAVTAFVSIMRGCDNMCTYCIVPFTRGRERSRPVSSIIDELQYLSDQGVKEITLLGQNLKDLRWLNLPVYKTKLGGLRFADLLEKVADVNPEIRIRFTSPHPKDFPDEVLQLIQEKPNICQSLHLPAQSGNSNVLERMRRGYTREAYLELVEHVRQILPNVAISSDFICGFCGETEEEFQDTLSLIEAVKYNTAYLFPYSMREKTTAHRRYQDDVPQYIKQRRLDRMIHLYRGIVKSLNRQKIGQLQLVLVEGYSKRSKLHLAGRNDANIKVIFPIGEIPVQDDSSSCRSIEPGDYIVVQINDSTSQCVGTVSGSG
ncbi:Radical SAM superfamily [Popillia japonica]|uniref:CDK5RAP1-like protein n=1 Tax=Popillia japonica TaxID=7064 RepID=A0AAW1LS59_POPJA